MQSLVLAAVLAAATTGVPTWHPAPSSPIDIAAGARCDFAVHMDPIDDEVQELDLATYPDGSPKKAVFAGRLILRLTNGSTGRTYDADASGSAIVGFGTDGSQHWQWIGPVLVGFGAANTNHAKGIYVLDGAYDFQVNADGSRIIHGAGHETDVCAELS
jgi:hypothetical protein